MQPEDIGPILAIAESKARKEWWRKQDAEMREDGNSQRPSQRYMRARHFAMQIISVMTKHVPEACHGEAVHDLMVMAYGHDVEIAQVPPERDAETARNLREVMLRPGMIVPRRTDN